MPEAVILYTPATRTLVGLLADNHIHGQMFILISSGVLIARWSMGVTSPVQHRPCAKDKTDIQSIGGRISTR